MLTPPLPTDAPPDAETLKKRKKLEKQYEDAAKEMEKQEAREAKGKGKGVGMAKYVLYFLPAFVLQLSSMLPCVFGADVYDSTPTFMIQC